MRSGAPPPRIPRRASAPGVSSAPRARSTCRCGGGRTGSPSSQRSRCRPSRPSARRRRARRTAASASSSAACSPHGRFVLAWRGRELAALERDGDRRWSLAAPAPIAVARWAPVDGYRVAYVAGAELRIANGDGTGDYSYGPARAGVAPAWRPDASHVLAYVDRRGAVNVAAVDRQRTLWRSGPVAGVVALAWTGDGDRLVVVTRRRLLLLGPAGQRLAGRAAPAGMT